MRNHHTPAYYLRGFTASRQDDGELWVYDKYKQKIFPSSPRATGLEKGMYSDELEAHFREQIENPANPVIDKVRDLAAISDDERRLLANYTVALRRRVPEGRARIKGHMPSIVETVRRAVHARIDELITNEPAALPLAEEKRPQIDERLDHFATDGSPIVWQDSLTEPILPHVLDRLLSMHWRYVHSPRLPLLASDNPVFMFDEGLRDPWSELTVAFSDSVALWIAGTPQGTVPIVSANSELAREFNRRTVSNSSRFVYSGSRSEQTLSFHCQESWRLTRLVI